jgi:hypothetical protein
MESTHLGLSTTRLGGEECVVIKYPDDEHQIALPVTVYDIYYKALSEEAALLNKREKPEGKASDSIMAYQISLSQVDIKPFYNAISEKQDVYDLFSLNKFVDKMHDTIADLYDLCRNISEEKDDVNVALYNNCMQDDVAAALFIVHRAYPAVKFDLKGIVEPGITDMKHYANPKNYTPDELFWSAEPVVSKINRFLQYDYLFTSEQQSLVLSMQQIFKAKAGMETNTDGNGE